MNIENEEKKTLNVCHGRSMIAARTGDLKNSMIIFFFYSSTVVVGWAHGITNQLARIARKAQILRARIG